MKTEGQEYKGEVFRKKYNFIWGFTCFEISRNGSTE
jgi:hypothetical protein